MLQCFSDAPNQKYSLHVISHRLSICFVVTTPFAVNAFLINHLNTLSNSHQVTLYVNLSLYPLSSELDCSKVKVINVDLERKLSVKKDIYAIFRLINLFRASKFDVVHSITPKAGLLAMLSGFLCRVPRRFHTFTGQIWVNYYGFKRIFYKKIDWLIVCFATHVFADSNSQMQFLINQSICKKSNISLLGPGSISGVDLSKFYFNITVRNDIRSKYGIKSTDCIFLFVGRLTKDKGVLDLLKAYDLLTNKIGRGAPIGLWFVGPDEEGLELLAKQLPEGKGLNIRWLDSTLSPQDFMTAADVLVLPSYREGFGSVLIEAAACGLPTIAYRIDGVVDAVEDGRSGLLCETGNIAALSKCMHSLLIDNDYRIQLGNYGYKQVQEQFSSNAITQAWMNFYLQLSNIEKFDTRPFKRIFDFLLAVIVATFIIFPITLISLCIWIGSGAPVIYWSERVGRNNQLFLMPKFRSMRVNTPAVAKHLLVNPGEHITRIGKFLRKTSLDELPQIWSILKGDMSFVGPRPALFNQQDLIDQRNTLGINQLRPGLTGWAQVNGRDEISLERKIQLDAQYAERQSLRFDLYILWLTFLKVIRSDGIAH